MSLIIRIVMTALALLVVANYIPGITVENFYVALVAALVLGVLNLIVKPILFILTLPITLITFGLFTFVINAVVFLLASSFVSGFEVEGFLPALLGSIIISFVSTLTHRILS